RKELEEDLQAQLNGARAAASCNGGALGHVRRALGLAERAGRAKVQRKATVLCAIEQVEDFETELSGDSLFKLPVLGGGEVDLCKSGTAELVGIHVAVGALHRGDNRRASDGVAADGRQLCETVRALAVGGVDARLRETGSARDLDARRSGCGDQ